MVKGGWKVLVWVVDFGVICFRNGVQGNEFC